MTADYEKSGIPLDRPGVRIARLAESIAVAEGPVRATGRSRSTASTTGSPTSTGSRSRCSSPHPPFVIGGGGPKILALAAREADDRRHQRQPAGRRRGERGRGQVDDAGRAPTRSWRWLRAAAGDRFDDLEIQNFVGFTHFTDDRQAMAEAMAPSFGVAARGGDQDTGHPRRHARADDRRPARAARTVADELRRRRRRRDGPVRTGGGQARRHLAPLSGGIAMAHDRTFRFGVQATGAVVRVGLAREGAQDRGPRASRRSTRPTTSSTRRSHRWSRSRSRRRRRRRCASARSCSATTTSTPRSSPRRRRRSTSCPTGGSSSASAPGGCRPTTTRSASRTTRPVVRIERLAEALAVLKGCVGPGPVLARGRALHDHRLRRHPEAGAAAAPAARRRGAAEAAAPRRPRGRHRRHQPQPAQAGAVTADAVQSSLAVGDEAQDRLGARGRGRPLRRHRAADPLLRVRDHRRRPGPGRGHGAGHGAQRRRRARSRASRSSARSTRSATRSSPGARSGACRTSSSATTTSSSSPRSWPDSPGRRRRSGRSSRPCYPGPLTRTWLSW